MLLCIAAALVELRRAAAESFYDSVKVRAAGFCGARLRCECAAVAQQAVESRLRGATGGGKLTDQLDFLFDRLQQIRQCRVECRAFHRLACGLQALQRFTCCRRAVDQRVAGMIKLEACAYDIDIPAYIDVF